MPAIRPAKLEVSQSRLYATAEAAEAFGRRLLLAHGLSEEHAATVARCLVRADLRGVDTHGLQYLPHYLDRVRRGLINAKPKLTVERVTPMIGGLDGDNGFGFVVATKAMETAIEMAHEFGVGIVTARRSTHFGMAANYVLQAMDAGMIGLVFTNASPGMPPWGGRDPIIGTSPIAAGAPSNNDTPFDLDMSPAAAARGKVRRAAWRGESIPLGYALDKHGKATTDPNSALDGGVMQPIGGPKGSGLSMMMDVFCGHHRRGLRRRGRQPVQGLRPAAGRRPLRHGDEAGSVRLERRISRAHEQACRACPWLRPRRRLRRNPDARRAGTPARSQLPPRRRAV